jgi:hypothetical protein
MPNAEWEERRSLDAAGWYSAIVRLEAVQR